MQLAAAGEDPSHTPFWLPFQQRTASYLRAQWAPAINACIATPELCAAVDDACDGEDCDRARDEVCAFKEECGNGTDDDCDLQVDEAPCK